MAHLTCVGSSYAEASRLIREFLDAGVTSFLALRGDPPAGVRRGRRGPRRPAAARASWCSSSTACRRERVPFAQHDVPGVPGAKRLGSGTQVTIAVAAFPNGHPRSRSRAQDLDTLLAKEAARREPRDLAAVLRRRRLPDVRRRRARRRRHHAHPARHHAGAERRATAPHARADRRGEPAELLARPRARRAPEAAAAVGIEHATALARDLLAGGASGIHLYTFNRSDAPLAVLGGAGLAPTRRGSPHDDAPRLPRPARSSATRASAAAAS